MTYVTHWSACPVMDSDEIQNLEDAMEHHRSHRLERSVREMAAHCAESCLASGHPWRCYFMAPVDLSKADAFDGSIPRGTGATEATVDVRGVKDPYVAQLLAEEQIRRQLARTAWARFPDLGGDS